MNLNSRTAILTLYDDLHLIKNEKAVSFISKSSQINMFLHVTIKFFPPLPLKIYKNWRECKTEWVYNNIS